MDGLHAEQAINATLCDHIDASINSDLAGIGVREQAENS